MNKREASRLAARKRIGSNLSLISLYLFILLVSFLSASCHKNNNGIDWFDDGDDLGAKQAFFSVPLDHDYPNMSKIELAMIRYPALVDKQGSILINPGGPGGSAVEYVKYFAQTSLGQKLRKKFDLIGFDPRGVGLSANFRCVDNPVPYFTIPTPTNEDELDQYVEIIQDYTAQCAERSGYLIEHIGSLNVVKDMELIRLALGEGKLNYIGLSYGSKLGALYADKYPQNVRAMVLDGVMPPSLTRQEANYEQAKSFERSLQLFLAACAENTSCEFGGEDPEGALRTLFDDLRQQPIPADNGRMLGQGDAEFGLAMALYSQSYWPWLEDALADAAEGDGSALLAWSDYYFDRAEDGTYSNGMDVLNAVNCIDYPPYTLEEATSLSDELGLLYPFFGPGIPYDDLFCTYWPQVSNMTPKVVNTIGAPQIMVVGTTGDPATPYKWSQRIVGELDSSFLITVEGESHCAIGKNNCIDAHYEQYLLNPNAGYSDAECLKTAAISTSNIPEFELPRFIRRW